MTILQWTDLYARPTSCPFCQTTLEVVYLLANVWQKRATALSPGDIGACGVCAYVMAFTEDFGLRELTTEEIDQVLKKPSCIKWIVKKRMTNGNAVEIVP